ncbi:hypothetical protein [uncultured Dubosiella sp.]|uniref:hypothetical protein n=1 Tax=uncultured Dubosiella sp. TaxID=1937011 RepID=UPI0025B19025|nr:hypothetical protein [uncultured Dubosiella sp.]
MRKRIKKICAALLAGLVSFGFSSPSTFAKEEATKEEMAVYKEFLKFGKQEVPFSLGYMLTSNNYGYMNFVEDFNENVGELLALKMSDLFGDVGMEPTEEQYIQEINHVLEAYKMDNSEDIKNQMKDDNLKTFGDYTMDAVDIGIQAFTLKIEGLEEADDFLEVLKTGLNEMNELGKDTKEMGEYALTTQMILKSTKDSKEFLGALENPNYKKVNEIASRMKKPYDCAIDYYFKNADKKVKEKTFNAGNELINDEVRKDIEKSDLYKKDAQFRNDFDNQMKILDQVSALKKSWTLGVSIGTLIGNLTVNSENLLYRIKEMNVLYEMSKALQEKLSSLYSECLSAGPGAESSKKIGEFVVLANYLQEVRLRGEYCVASIATKDAGLLNWFNQQTKKDGEQYYKDAVERVKGFREQLKKFIVSAPEPEAKVDFSGIYLNTPGANNIFDTVWINQDKTFYEENFDYDYDQVVGGAASGSFTNLKKVEEYKYSTIVKDVKQEELDPAKFGNRKFVELISTSLQNGDEVLVYLPGYPYSKLSGNEKLWIQPLERYGGNESLRKPYIYNKTKEWGFYSIPEEITVPDLKSDPVTQSEPEPVEEEDANVEQEMVSKLTAKSWTTDSVYSPDTLPANRILTMNFLNENQVEWMTGHCEGNELVKTSIGAIEYHLSLENEEPVIEFKNFNVGDTTYGSVKVKISLIEGNDPTSSEGIGYSSLKIEPLDESGKELFDTWYV